MKQSLPPRIAAEVHAAAEDWTRTGKTARLWNHDKTLWTNADEDKWLGWLDVADRQLEQKQLFEAIAKQAKSGGYRDAVVLGMGGSSLCPEVLAITFGRQAGFPALHVLDSTDPAQVKAIETLADPKTTLYIVSSKSGSTLEPNIFKQYFFDKAARDGSRFIAVTDPGSKMEQVAKADGFSRICYGVPSIGGRYSALSDFGMVPGAVAGLDIPKLLERATHMAKLCREPDAAKNPGISLGLALGTLAKHGHDKITLIASPTIYDLGAWLEQLIAESTGKIGRALIPVDREPAGPPEVYGNDRTFVYIRFTPEIESTQEDAVAQLERAGHPVIRIDVGDQYDLGAEFFRWEIAVPVAGAIIGINPFDQPDVEASKIATRKLTDEYEKTGKLPPESPILEADGMKFFTDARNASQLAGKTAVELLRSHLNRLGAGDYFALLGFIRMNLEHEEDLQEMRLDVRDKKRVATCLGFGPRFLHSTGQAYKGGPNSGVFLQVTCDDAQDIPIPGQKFTFGTVKAAQARGDFDVLAERQRRALRVHLPADLRTGLATLGAAIKEALR
jgi:transaldolase / glucose-6-phosphate isomerase